jgi:hypothetical protein
MSQKIYLSLTEGLILKTGCWPRKAFINEQQRNRTTRTQAKPKQPDAAPGLTNPPFPSWSYQRPAGAWRIIWPPLRTIGKGSSQERKGGEGRGRAAGRAEVGRRRGARGGGKSSCHEESTVLAIRSKRLDRWLAARPIRFGGHAVDTPGFVCPVGCLLDLSRYFASDFFFL